MITATGFGRRIVGILVCMMALIVTEKSYSAESNVAVTDLRCEYRYHPLGIDILQPRLSWIPVSHQRGQKQTAYQVLVSSSEKNLSNDIGDLWDSGIIESNQSTNVMYDGKPMKSRLKCFWKVRIRDKNGQYSEWSEPAMWTMGLLNENDWQAQWIGAGWIKENAGPLPWLRKTFTIEDNIAQAMVYVCAIGYYELYVNGRKVDEYVLSPATTDLKKRALYLTHDISDYLVKGENCIGIWLGRGWCTRLLKPVSNEGPMVMARCEIEIHGGSKKTVVTDRTWKSHPGNITPIDTGTRGGFGGELYDARKENPEWNTVSLDDSDWQPAKVFNPGINIISAQMVQPDRIHHEVSPAEIEELSDGSYMIDMGRNFSGWFEIRFPEGTAGQKIYMEFGDKRFPDDKLQSYTQRDEYIMRGKGAEIFRMRFNYHAFRWVKLTGLDKKPLLNDIRGYSIHSGYENAAEFECSNELLNRIHNTVLKTYRCLTPGGYIVDCPTRERSGYGGDGGTSLETGMFNFDVSAFYTKWLDDWRDAQDPVSGQVTPIAPFSGIAGGGPAWGGICVTLPWQVYLNYGDICILEQCYPMMLKWLEFLETKTKNNILEPYIEVGQKSLRWSFLGDWVPPGRNQGDNRIDDHSTHFFNNCYYLYNVQLAAKIAKVLGKKSDAVKYTRYADKLSMVIHKRFVNPDKKSYVNGEQPYLAMPLLFNIVPAELRKGIMNSLEHDILVTQKGHLNSGMHGTYFMVKYLMQEDRNDLIYEFTNKKTYPGWGYMLEQGATTIWEEWHGNNSQIHNTHLSIGSWFIQGLGGIKIDEQNPGFSHFFVNPGIVDGLKYVRARYNSIKGEIQSKWKQENNRIILNVIIPTNTTATVSIPAKNAESVTENGKQAGRGVGIEFLGMEGSKAVYRIESGEYSFVSDLN